MGIGPGAGKGGARQGAGRPRGSKNKRTIELHERLEALDFDLVGGLVEMANDSEDEKIRLDARKTLMPYVYPRLAAQDISLSSDDWPDVRIELVMNDKPESGD